MSERDLRRIEVLSDVRAGRRTVAAAAAVLAVSERQAYRLLARYETDGGSGLIHKARGKTSNRSHNDGIWKYAVQQEANAKGLLAAVGEKKATHDLDTFKLIAALSERITALESAATKIPRTPLRDA